MEPQDYLTLGALAGIWGASFLFIKVAVGEMAPPVLVFGRTAMGAVAVYAALRLGGIPLRGIRRHWRAGLVVAVANAALPYSLFAFGERFIDSSLAGILNATLPLWTALMAPLWIEAEALRPRQVAGLALGFAGAVVAARPTGGILSASLVGAGACLVATLSYAFATHYSRRAFAGLPAQVPAFMQCAGAAVILLPLAVLLHPARMPSPAALGAVAALGLGGTGLAMIMAYRLIARIGASRTTVVTYLLPPAAVFWGFVVLHERLTVYTVLALVLILGGVYLITGSSRGRTARPLVDEALAEA
ncbi:MAG TPA: DMT family transporter [Candidatus Dormibacteraeota bacterium]|nr:DMT family transporter [Candidatus Dormibacteraeota bacterium]